VGLTSAAVCGAVLFLGAGFVGASPRFLLGGLVFFIGLATLWDWLVDGWRRMPLSDYILVLGILLVIVHFGFLTGVGVGLAAAIGLFVVNYSRISVVREQSDGARMRSTVERPVPHERILREHGGRIAVFRLQGFLFFGTANALLARLTARMHDTAQPLLCILLDFRQVFGFDISALNSFHRLAQVARTRNVHMVLTAAPSRFLVQLGRAAGPDAEAFQIREDLDRGLEWCEDRLLEAELEEMERRRAQGGQDDFFLSVVDDLMLHLEQKERFEEIAERLGPWLEERTYKPGEVIIAQGRPLEGLFLLLRGTAREYVERENVASLRLRTMGPGATAGELGAASGRAAAGRAVPMAAARAASASPAPARVPVALRAMPACSVARKRPASRARVSARRAMPAPAPTAAATAGCSAWRRTTTSAGAPAANASSARTVKCATPRPTSARRSPAAPAPARAAATATETVYRARRTAPAARGGELARAAPAPNPASPRRASRSPRAAGRRAARAAAMPRESA
jgi:CRP-like cAMP-binding protein/anti-anti-sigma regulatory factor